MSDSINKQIKQIIKKTDVVTHTQEEVNILLEVISRYELLVNGNQKTLGLLYCITGYYQDYFIEIEEEIQKLKKTVTQD